MKINSYILRNIKPIPNKKIIITGANSGIGFSMAKTLISLGAYVIFACRNEIKAKEAMEKIKLEYPNGKMSYLYFDQSTFKTSKSSIEEIINLNNLDFDVIIFNAGILSPKERENNEDGLPLTIATNYINVIYISERLSELISDDKERRFIYQSSLTSRLVSKKLDLHNNKIPKFKQYSFSKYCVSNYKNYKSFNNKTNIKYLLCEPGITNSNIIRNFPNWLQKLGNWFLNLFMIDVNKAALNGVMCSANENIKDGDEYRPGCMFSICGYPKLYKKSKRINKKLIEETMRIINE